MMDFNEFPHTCKFYRIEKNPNDPLDRGHEVVSYEGICDIQMTGSGIGTVAEKSSYTIFMPLPMTDGKYQTKIKKGDKFKGNEYGIERLGNVLDITTSQLGFVSVFIESMGV